VEKVEHLREWQRLEDKIKALGENLEQRRAQVEWCLRALLPNRDRH